MKPHIKEIIVVEGRDDITAVKAAVDAEVVAVNGFSVGKNIEKVKAAYERKGIVVLTDPDFAGLKIRDYIQKRFPEAKHAYINRAEGTKNGDIGVENASPEAIIKALEKARCESSEKREVFKPEILIEHRLTGYPDSKTLREKLGKVLGIGYSNGKQLLSKLNRYDISMEEFLEAVKKINEK